MFSLSVTVHYLNGFRSIYVKTVRDQSNTFRMIEYIYDHSIPYSRNRIRCKNTLIEFCVFTQIFQRNVRQIFSIIATLCHITKKLEEYFLTIFFSFSISPFWKLFAFVCPKDNIYILKYVFFCWQKLALPAHSFANFNIVDGDFKFEPK